MTVSRKLENRGRMNLIATVVATIAIGILVNVLVSGARIRADLTENSVNLLSEASRAAAQALDGLEVRVYVSPDLPESIPMGGGREMKLQGLPRKLQDKLAEYAAYAPGMTITRVTDDLIGEAERNRVKTFAGRGADLSEAGRFEFKKYVLGLSFHWKNQVEVFELALQPEYYEFEITRRLVRLKDKAEFAVTMKDMLEAAKGVGDAVKACVVALEEASGEEDAPADPLALLTGEGNEKRLATMKGAAPNVKAACGGLSTPIERAKGIKTDLEAFSRVVLISEALMKETEAFTGALEGQEAPPVPQLVGSLQRLVAIGKAVDGEVRAVEDSPGQRRIGFVCHAKAFCPFPDPEPLYPRELAMAATQNPQGGQMVQQQLSFLDRLQEQISMVLQQVNQGLFRGRGFDIVRVDLDDDLPDDLAALVVFGPSGDFTDWQLHQLDQFVLRGGSLVAFVAPWDVGLQRFGKGGQLEKPSMARLTSNFNAFLAHYGLKPNGALVLEPTSHGELSLMQFLQQGDRLVPFQSVPVPYPMLPTFSDMDESDPLVRATPTLTLPFTTWFELSPPPGVETVALVSSSTKAASVNETAFPLDPRQQLDAVAKNPAGKAMAVVAQARGEFTSWFSGKTRPEKPETDKPDDAPDDTADDPAVDTPTNREVLDKGKGRILAIGSNLGLTSLGKDVIFEGFDPTDIASQDGFGKLFGKLEDFRLRFENWSSRLDQVQQTLQGNLQFLQNVLDWSVQRDAIAELRSKQYAERPLELTEASDQTFVRTVGVALSPVLLVVFGALWSMRRRARRRRLSA